MRSRVLAALLVAVTMPGVTLAAAESATASGATIKGASDVTAAPWTPSLATSGTDGSVEQVRQLVQCNDTMYAVGRFSQVKQGATTYTRNNAFSFSATDGTVTSWNPNVNGDVNSVALSSDCQTVYLGGSFTLIGRNPVSNLAAVDSTTGQVLSNFPTVANRKVNTLVMAGGHLLVGGAFTTINGSGTDYMVSLNPTKGRNDGYLNLSISGHYVYRDQGGGASASNSTQVYNTALSPNGSKLLVMGVFTSVGGVGRRQIFMLDLGATSASVDSWYSPEFDQNCSVHQPFWLQDATWSPDGSTIYTAATGYKPATDSDPNVVTGYSTYESRGGLCDSAAAFPSASSPTPFHQWVNYTGCDSLYSTAADATHVYVGGHERYANNFDGCNQAGPGSVLAPGMAGLNPLSGQLDYNPTRARGLGADDMLRTTGGLWIGSDNAQNSSACAGESNHAGICLIPADQL